MNTKNKNLDFAVRIKESRNKLGYTQIGLAKELGVNKATIQNYEAGLLPKGGYLIKLSKILKCSIDWMLTGEIFGKEGIEKGIYKVEKNENDRGVAESVVEYEQNNQRISDLITKTVNVLESDTIYRHALASNINAFHHAIEMNYKVEKVEARLLLLESDHENLKKRLMEAEKEAHSHKKNTATQG